MFEKLLSSNHGGYSTQSDQYLKIIYFCKRYLSSSYTQTITRIWIINYISCLNLDFIFNSPQTRIDLENPPLAQLYLYDNRDFFAA